MVILHRWLRMQNASSGSHHVHTPRMLMRKLFYDVNHIPSAGMRIIKKKEKRFPTFETHNVAYSMIDH